MQYSKSPMFRSRIIKTSVMAVLLMVGLACLAAAHPLGNFTINHFAHLEAGADRLSLHYVIDMAEIPAYQELQKIDTDGDGKPSATELKAYAAQLAASLTEGFRLTLDGEPLPLSLAMSQATMPEGGSTHRPGVGVGLGDGHGVAAGSWQTALQPPDPPM